MLSFVIGGGLFTCVLVVVLLCNTRGLLSKNKIKLNTSTSTEFHITYSCTQYKVRIMSLL